MVAAIGAAPLQTGSRSATLWLYAPTATNDTWASWFSAVRPHAHVAVTGVAPCLYLVGADGTFTLQVPPAVAAVARNWTARFVSDLGINALPLIAASGTGMNAVISNATLSAALIAATVSEARALGLSGYNLQLEEPGSPLIKEQWSAFLRSWLAALSPLTLSVIIGGDCRARDWMYMDCGDYVLLALNATDPHNNLRLISEATYEGEPTVWREFLANLVRGATPALLNLGLEYKPPLLNPANGCLPAATAANVTGIYVWVDPPADNATAAAAWPALEAWVNATSVKPPARASANQSNTVVIIEDDFILDNATLAGVAGTVVAHGGVAFSVLSMMAWNGSFSPSPASPLPPPSSEVAAFLRAVRATAPAPLRVWGGVSLCPGPEYACMLNYTQSAFTGEALAAAALGAGFDGVQIYVSPYCNNADCKRTTGKYAKGIAAMISAFRSRAPDLEIALLANEWDNVEIIAAADPPPAAIFSYQTVFFFTTITDCVRDAGDRCGAGESIALINKGGQNFTAIVDFLAQHEISWIGMLHGATFTDNPADYWPALTRYSNVTAADDLAAPPLSFLAIGDWGGQDLPPFTQPGQLATAEGLALAATSLDAQFVLALGDNAYALGFCNNNTLAPYNNTCPARFDPRAGTVDDTRFLTTFEEVYTAPALRDLPWYVIAGNQDALGNVSASIAYTNRSSRWRHPYYFHKVSSPLWAGSELTLDVLMIDVTLCYGIEIDPWHTRMCAEQAAWLDTELAASTAAFLWVAGHYPIWSACSHGNTQWAVDTILPRLRAGRATGYMSGHDHCGEFIDTRAEDGLVFVVSGMGDGCCYSAPNVANVPPHSLTFLLAEGYNPTNTTGGFASFQIERATEPTLRVAIHGDDGGVLFVSSPIAQRVATKIL